MPETRSSPAILSADLMASRQGPNFALREG